MPSRFFLIKRKRFACWAHAQYCEKDNCSSFPASYCVSAAVADGEYRFVVLAV